MVEQLRYFMQVGAKRGKQSLRAIPYLFTFSNAILGFLSVTKALDADFTAAAYCILLAAFLDGFDGRIARALGSTSIIGMELDSLADAVSFCVSPVILLYSWELQDFGGPGILILLFYLCAGLFRLARFNSLGQQNQMLSFWGLPTTLAAFFIASVVLYEDWISLSRWYFLLNESWIILLLGLISLLMISSLRFPAFKQMRIYSFGSIFTATVILISFAAAYIGNYPFFLLLFLAYFIFCLFWNCYLAAAKHF